MFKRIILLFSCVTVICLSVIFISTLLKRETSPDPKLVKKDYQLPYTHPFLEKPDHLYRQNILDSAILGYQKTLRLFAKENNWNGYVKSLYRIGAAYMRRGKNDSSFYYLTFGKKTALKKLGIGDIGTINTHYFLGEYYQQQGNASKALAYYLKCSVLLERYHGNDHPTMSYYNDAIGSIYLFYFENYLKAEQYYLSALKQREKELKEPTVDIGNSYYNLAITYRIKGDYDKAISYNKRAARIYNTLKGNYQYHITNCLNNAANIYYDMDSFKVAAYNYILAIKKIKDIENKSFPVLINYYNNVGAAFLEMKEYGKAKENINTSLNINHLSPDTIELIKSYFNYGIILKEQNNLELAQNYYTKCIALSKKIYPLQHPQVALIYQEIGKLKEKQGDFNSAHYYIQLSMSSLLGAKNLNKVNGNPLPESINNNLQLLKLLNDKARILEFKFKQDNKPLALLKTALDCYQLADKVIKENRRSYEREGSKLILANYSKRTYEKAISCGLMLNLLTSKNEYLEHVFDFMEKSKSTLLLESLKEAEAVNSVGVPKDLKREEKELNISLGRIDFALYKEKNKEGNINLDKIERLDSIKLINERKLEKLKDQLNRNYPNYFLAKYNSESIRLAKIQQLIGEKEEVIEYYWGDSVIYIMGITQNSIKTHKIQNQQQVQTNIATYIKLLSEEPLAVNQEWQQKKYEEYKKVAKELFDDLVKPVLVNSLMGKDNLNELIIVPDGLLSSIPFESLITQKTNSERFNYKTLPYLLTKFQISYAYSCNVLFRNSNEKSLLGKLKPLFLGYAEPKEKMMRNSNRKESLLLPNSVNLEDLAASVGGEYCQATRYNFINKIPDYNVIHLYIHANGSEIHPSESKFFLKKENSDSDSILYCYELYQMDFKDKLIVLNACETGVGKQYGGEGIYSLSRGFAYSGSNAVIMSLWKINESPTFQLSEYFYEELPLTHNPAVALNNAKLKFLEEQDFLTAHPAYWAGLVTVINSNTTDSNFLIGYWLICAFITVSLMLLGFLIYFGLRGKKMKVQIVKNYILSPFRTFV